MAHHKIYRALSNHLHQQSQDGQRRMTHAAVNGDWQAAAHEYRQLDQLHQQRHDLFKAHKTAVLRNMGVTVDEQ